MFLPKLKLMKEERLTKEREEVKRILREEQAKRTAELKLKMEVEKKKKLEQKRKRELEEQKRRENYEWLKLKVKEDYENIKEKPDEISDHATMLDSNHDELDNRSSVTTAFSIDNDQGEAAKITTGTKDQDLGDLMHAQQSKIDLNVNLKSVEIVPEEGVESREQRQKANFDDMTDNPVSVSNETNLRTRSQDNDSYVINEQNKLSSCADNEDVGSVSANIESNIIDVENTNISTGDSTRKPIAVDDNVVCDPKSARLSSCFQTEENVPKEILPQVDGFSKEQNINTNSNDETQSKSMSLNEYGKSATFTDIIDSSLNAETRVSVNTGLDFTLSSNDVVHSDLNLVKTDDKTIQVNNCNENKTNTMNFQQAAFESKTNKDVIRTEIQNAIIESSDDKTSWGCSDKVEIPTGQMECYTRWRDFVSQLKRFV